MNTIDTKIHAILDQCGTSQDGDTWFTINEDDSLCRDETGVIEIIVGGSPGTGRSYFLRPERPGETPIKRYTVVYRSNETGAQAFAPSDIERIAWIVDVVATWIVPGATCPVGPHIDQATPWFATLARIEAINAPHAEDVVTLDPFGPGARIRVECWRDLSTDSDDEVIERRHAEDVRRYADGTVWTDEVTVWSEAEAAAVLDAVTVRIGRDGTVAIAVAEIERIAASIHVSGIRTALDVWGVDDLDALPVTELAEQTFDRDFDMTFDSRFTDLLHASAITITAVGYGSVGVPTYHGTPTVALCWHEDWHSQGGVQEIDLRHITGDAPYTIEMILGCAAADVALGDMARGYTVVSTPEHRVSYWVLPDAAAVPALAMAVDTDTFRWVYGASRDEYAPAIRAWLDAAAATCHVDDADGHTAIQTWRRYLAVGGALPTAADIATRCVARRRES